MFFIRCSSQFCHLQESIPLLSLVAIFLKFFFRQFVHIAFIDSVGTRDCSFGTETARASNSPILKLTLFHKVVYNNVFAV